MQPSNLANAVPSEALARPDVAPARLLIGLLQGIALYGLFRAGHELAWSATVPLLFEPLLLVALIAPVILGSSLGHMGGRRAALWTAVAALIIAALGLHDAWRKAPAAALQLPAPPLMVALVGGFFIAHAMVIAGVGERRRIASYQAYFETAWKLAVQLCFSGAFVGALWAVLFLGESLFMLIQLAFLRELLQQSWFAIPISTFAFAWALHITDVRPAIVRGIRTLLLVLMSWVLPVATLIVGGFLASLLLTGLAPLWATRHAASVLLGAAAVLVVMVNAAWQNGAAAAAVAPLIRHSARLAALLLAPIVLIAVYALGLRVADYGWTDERIIAAACLLVAACYAAGYAVAALRGGWLDRIAGVNIGTAFVVLAVLLALYSPLADPARLSVNSQLARLASGKVAADKFDFSYLRFNGARYGRAALARMKDSTAAAVRNGAAAALALTAPAYRAVAIEPKSAPANLAANITVWPAGTRLPATFLAANWGSQADRLTHPACLWRAGAKCDAFLIDLDGDGKPEVLVVGTERGGGAAIMGEDARDGWRSVTTLPFDVAGCTSARAGLIAGHMRAVKPVASVLEIDGKPIGMQASGFFPFACWK